LGKDMSEWNGPPTEEWLDSLALIHLQAVGRLDDFKLIMASYIDDPDAMLSIIHGLCHVAGDAINALSLATGQSPGDILGHCRDWIAEKAAHDG
jgi:hypothetical protein